MYYVCPNCHCDNQDMIVGMGNNTMSCEACDYEWDEADAIEVQTGKEGHYDA